MNTSIVINDSTVAKEHALTALLQGLADLGFGTDRNIDGADAVDAISELFADVATRQLLGTDLEPKVIVAESQSGYWSNHDGWGELGSATIFFRPPTSLPNIGVDDAKVILLSEAEANALTENPLTPSPNQG